MKPSASLAAIRALSGVSLSALLAATGLTCPTAAFGGTIDIPDGVDIGSSLTFDLSQTFNVNTGATGTYSGQISEIGDPGFISKIGGGTLVITNNSNSFSLGAIVSGGAIAVTGNNVLGAGPITLDGGTLRAAAGSLGLATNSIFFTAAGGAIDTGSFDLTINAMMGDGEAPLGAFSKLGAGTLTVTGFSDNNTYATATNIAEGTLSAGAANIFSRNSSYTVAGGAFINMNGFAQDIGSLAGNGTVTTDGATLTTGFDDRNSVFSGEIAGSGRLVKVGAGILTMSGASSYFGGTTIAEGTLHVGNDSALGTGIVTVAGGRLGYADGIELANNLVLNSGATQLQVLAGTATQSGTISQAGGSRSIEKTGAGTLVLDTANTYSGGTVIAGGTLRVENDNAMGSGAVTTTGSTLDYADGVDIANPIVLNSNATKLQVLSGAATQSGNISELGGARQLEKTGAGTLILSGDNTYSGRTKITAGILVAATDTALAAESDVVLSSGAGLALADGVMVDINSLSGAGNVLIGSSDPVTTLAIGFAGGDDTTFSGSIGGAGSLELLGGTLTLTGESEIGGLLWICDCSAVNIKSGSFTATEGSFVGGKLTVSDGATFASGNMAVTGTMRISGPGSTASVNGNSVTVVAAVFAPALLSIENGGVLNSRGGAGILSAPEQSATASVSGSGSRWNVDEGLAIGAFGAAGTLKITDGGVVNSSDFTTIEIGSKLALGTGGLSGTIVAPTIINDGKIVANFTDISTLSADVEGEGSLVKSGAGKLVLTGANTYSGPTVVNAGGLFVNGSLTRSDIAVNRGGTLGGTGTVGSTTINTGGAIAPGNSVGVLTVAGDLTFASGSFYTLDISAAGSDLIEAMDNGVVDLSGGTVRAAYGPGTMVAKRYRILHAEGGLDGTKFAGVEETALEGFKTTLTYDPATVWLDLDLAMRDYGGLSRNQQRVANALTGFFDRTGAIPAEFATLTPQGLSLASGEVGTGSIGAGIYAADRFLDVITDPFVAGRGAPAGTTEAHSAQAYAPLAGSAPGVEGVYAALLAKGAALSAEKGLDSRWNMWGAAYGGELSIDGDAILGSHDTSHRVHGLAAGFDHSTGDGVWGFALGGAKASFGLSDGHGSGNSGIFNAGLYGSRQFGAAYLTGAVAYGLNSVSTTRVLGGSELSADFNAHTISGRIETGYRFDTAALGVTPYAAIQASSFFLPGYDETASGSDSFALSYDGRTTAAMRVELGARFDRSFATSDETLLTLRGRAGWIHDGNADRSVTAIFQELPGTAFIVDGAARVQNSALVNAGAEIAWTNGFSAGISLQGEFSSNATSLSGFAKIGYRW